MASKHCPQGTDEEMRLRSWLEDTTDIPCFWLKRACIDIRRNDENPHVPPSATIRKVAATLFRAAKERSSGDVAYSPYSGRQPLQVSREIDKMSSGPVVAGLLTEPEIRRVIGESIRKEG